MLLVVGLVVALVVAGLVALRLVIDDASLRFVALATGGVVVVVVLLGAVIGLGDGGSTADESDAPTEAPADAPPGTTPSWAIPLQLAQVELFTTRADQLPPVVRTLGDLHDGEPLVLGVRGLDPATPATIHQCPTGADQPTECHAGLPVAVDGGRRSLVSLELVERLDAGGDGVNCTATPCSIVVFGSSRLEVRLVFGGPAAPPVELVADPAALAPGGRVSASATQLPPGARVAFAVCRPDGDGGVECGAETEPARATAAGEATAELEVSPDRCGRGDTCAVAVAEIGSDPLAFAPLRLLGRSGAGYDAGRLAPGLAVAVVLLLAGAVLLRRTDWTPVEGDPFASVVLPDDPFADDPG